MSEAINANFRVLNSNEPCKTIELDAEDTVSSALPKICEQFHLKQQFAFILCHGQILRETTQLSKVMRSPDDVFDVYERPNYKIEERESLKPQLKQLEKVSNPFGEIQLIDIPPVMDESIMGNMFEQGSSSCTGFSSFGNLLNNLDDSDEL